MESRGKINCYEPEQPGHGMKTVFYTINLAVGVTPFMKRFDGIMCQSLCYRLRDPRIVTVRYAWYRPSVTVFRTIPDWHEQVLSGGLVCDKLDIAIANQMIDDPVKEDWTYEQFKNFVSLTYVKE